MCLLRLQGIINPTTTIFGVISISLSVVIALGNTIAFVVLCIAKQRTQSIRIMTSLIIADGMAGYILLPIYSYQLFNEKTDCTLDAIRSCVGFTQSGTSIITICLLSYDRYLVLTKYGSYNRYMSNIKMKVLIFMSWIFPAISIILLRLLETKYSFFISLSLVFLVPLLLSFVNYYRIAKVIYTHENKMEHSSNECPLNPSTSGKVDSTDTSTKRRSALLRQKRIRLAKTFLLLITLYILCLLPVIVWIFLVFLNDISSNPFISAAHLNHVFMTSVIAAIQC